MKKRPLSDFGFLGMRTLLSRITIMYSEKMNKICSSLVISTLVVKIQNLKVDFKTGGTWRRVGQ